MEAALHAVLIDVVVTSAPFPSRDRARRSHRRRSRCRRGRPPPSAPRTSTRARRTPTAWSPADPPRRGAGLGARCVLRGRPGREGGAGGDRGSGPRRSRTRPHADGRSASVTQVRRRGGTERGRWRRPRAGTRGSSGCRRSGAMSGPAPCAAAVGGSPADRPAPSGVARAQGHRSDAAEGEPHVAHAAVSRRARARRRTPPWRCSARAASRLCGRTRTPAAAGTAGTRRRSARRARVPSRDSRGTASRTGSRGARATSARAPPRRARAAPAANRRPATRWRCSRPAWRGSGSARRRPPPRPDQRREAPREQWMLADLAERRESRRS